MVVLNIMLACGVSTSGGDEPINGLNEPVSVDPATGVSPTPDPTTPGTIGNGTWTVGMDIRPGTYRTSGADIDDAIPMCVWTVQGKDGNFVDSGLTDKGSDPQQIKLVKGQDFKTSGCMVWKMR
jgi:hypothetical protein